MRLRELCDGWLEVPARWRDLEVRGIACDSRRVKPGDLFVAVPGHLTNGQRYIPQALRAGAVSVLGEAKAPRPAASGVRHPYLRVRCAREALGRVASMFYRHPNHALHVVGVTGTKGKTTTTWLLDAILRRTGAVTGLFGTVENRIASRVFPSANTTAGCLDLHRWMRDLLDVGGTHATLEVSSHAIEQQRTAAVGFRCGILTNISPEHLDYHRTFENYREIKASFFRTLPQSGFAVLPREVPYAQEVAARTRATIRWYSGDVQDFVQDIQPGTRGMEFVWKGFRVRTRLWGYHNVLNALAAMTAAECLDADSKQIAEALEDAAAPPGRLEQVRSPVPFRVIVDYAHTDAALEAVLTAIRPLTGGRLITIFGCGGDRDRGKRSRMGAVAENYSDQIIVTSDNPRSEPPLEILAEIKRGLRRPNDAVFVEDRREAIGLGIRMAREGDTVLIAGKGHETYQEFQDRVVEFDDRKVAREFLDELLVPAQGIGV